MIVTHNLQKSLIACWFILCMGTGAVAAAHGVQPPPQPIRDLRYGETLFDFYQDRYFSAITDLLVADQRAPITAQGDDPELLLGALYLSYGLHDAATGIFNHLLAKNPDTATRDRVWFYLGKLNYLDGRNADAVDAYTRITDSLEKPQEEERRHYLANAYINLGKYPEAITTLEKLPDEGVWKAYAQYNLGIALIRAGNIKDGNHLLNAVGTMQSRNDEEYSLRDKVNIALGYAALRAGATTDAAADFSRVSLNSPYTARALLGLGWAYSAQQKLPEALTAWLEFDNMSSTDTAAQEALLAIPYTLEKLNAREPALSRYEDAVAVYERELAALDAALKSAKEGQFTRAMRPASLTLSEDWTRADAHSPGFPAAIYPTIYLGDLLASRELQQAYRDYRDLLYLQDTALHWQEQIPNLQMMLTERRQNYESRLPLIQKEMRANRWDDLRRRRDALAATLAEIESTDNAEGLAMPDERTLLAKLNRLKTRLDTLRSRGIDVAADTERVRILHGMLQWQLNTNYPARLWQVRKGLNSVDTGLETVAQAKSSLESTWQNAPRGFEGFAERISLLKTRLDALGTRADVAVIKQEQRLNDLISAAIAVKKRQVENYRLRAQYALARLHDELLHEKNPP